MKGPIIALVSVICCTYLHVSAAGAQDATSEELIAQIGLLEGTTKSIDCGNRSQCKSTITTIRALLKEAELAVLLATTASDPAKAKKDHDAVREALALASQQLETIMKGNVKSQ